VDVEYHLGSEGFALDLSPGFDALREALVNMLMHTDHFSPGCPRIRIFTDHIEFYNPGGLPKPLDELKGKDISLPRNPIITKLFRVVKLAENAGYGLDNMEYNWKKYNQTTPQFDVAFDSVIVKFQLTQAKSHLNENREVDVETEIDLLETLRKNFGPISVKLQLPPEENITTLKSLYETFVEYLQKDYGATLEKIRKEYGETLEEHQRRNSDKKVSVLMLIIIDNYVSAEDIASLLGFSLRTVKRFLKEFKDLDLITRKGGKRSGLWHID
jgi:predicted HTH transcriptional regulator